MDRPAAPWPLVPRDQRGRALPALVVDRELEGGRGSRRFGPLQSNESSARGPCVVPDLGSGANLAARHASAERDSEGPPTQGRIRFELARARPPVERRNAAARARVELVRRGDRARAHVDVVPRLPAPRHAELLEVVLHRNLAPVRAQEVAIVDRGPARERGCVGAFPGPVRPKPRRTPFENAELAAGDGHVAIEHAWIARIVSNEPVARARLDRVDARAERDVRVEPEALDVRSGQFGELIRAGVPRFAPHDVARAQFRPASRPPCLDANRGGHESSANHDWARLDRDPLHVVERERETIRMRRAQLVERDMHAVDEKRIRDPLGKRAPRRRRAHREPLDRPHVPTGRQTQHVGDADETGATQLVRGVRLGEEQPEEDGLDHSRNRRSQPGVANV
jgi:hypothetical protein